MKVYKYILKKMNTRTKKTVYTMSIGFSLILTLLLYFTQYKKLYIAQSNTLYYLIIINILFVASLFLAPMTSAIYNIERANDPDYDKTSEMDKRFNNSDIKSQIPLFKFHDIDLPVFIAIPLFFYYNFNKEKYIERIETIEKEQNELYFSIMGIRYKMGEHLNLLK